MKNVLALALLAVLLPAGITTTSAFTSVPMSEVYKDYNENDTAEENPRFGFMDFYYNEPFETIAKQYPLENEFKERWSTRNMDLKGFLGFKKTGTVTFVFENKKLKSISIFVQGDKRNLAMNLITEFGAPVYSNRDPERMENYIWKKGKIAIIYQHDNNEKGAMVDFCTTDQIAFGY